MCLQPPVVPGSTYTDEYYMSFIDGATEFRIENSGSLPKVIEIALREAKLTHEMCALDIGCGVGELVWHLRNVGTRALGVDYSSAALRVARRSHYGITEKGLSQHISLAQADGRQLPIVSESVDRVFMLDVVEHMSPEELNDGLREVRRVLAPNGMLLIHTMPNTWYYALGYPIFRLFQRLRGIHLPRNARERFRFSHTHINEQSPLRLAGALRRAGFAPRVWLENARRYETRERNRLLVLFMRAVTTLSVLKLIFCNDVFAVAIRQDP